MKSSLPTNESSESAPKSLDELVSLLAAGALPAAVKKRSFIVNDIPEKFFISADENILATVLGSLLHTVVNHSDNSCIRIAAQKNGSDVQVNIKDSCNFTDYSVADDLLQVQQLAQTLGGYVSITNMQEKNITIAFSFPNLKVA